MKNHFIARKVFKKSLKSVISDRSLKASKKDPYLYQFLKPMMVKSKLSCYVFILNTW